MRRIGTSGGDPGRARPQSKSGSAALDVAAKPKVQPVSEVSVGILTSLTDDHAPPVAWALGQAGVEVFQWNWSRFPGLSTQSLEISGGESPSCVAFLEDRQLPNAFSSFWYRRKAPVTPHATTHPADVDFVRRQASEYLHGELYALPVRDWINEPGAARRAESKALQLIVADRCGFSIPPTLMTNDPRRVEAFRTHHGGHVVMKTFLPQTWRDEEGRDHFTETAVIDPDETLNEESVRLAPAIYQALMPKQHELRITAFGNYIETLALYSQQYYASTDWRMDQTLGRVPAEWVPTPPDLEMLCRKVMRELGIAYGAFDVIVDPDGTYQFIEVNQSGQFLFFDDADPEIGILQKFCACLTRDQLKPSEFPSLGQYYDSGAGPAHDEAVYEAKLAHDNPLFIDEARFG